MNKLDVKILLAEDEPTLQYLFERQLRALGYSVMDIADNGLLAVEKALKDSYQFIFMDVRMPLLDGVAAAVQIRRAEQQNGRHTIIIGMTAFPDKERCFDAGMDEFLQKPVVLRQLEEVLNKWLEAVPSDTKLNTVGVTDESSFRRTDQRLSAIQSRIDDLRKRVGLE